MPNPTRGERNCNLRNIERVAANKWQGHVSDANYCLTQEFRQNGGRFNVFTPVEWGIRPGVAAGGLPGSAWPADHPPSPPAP